MLVKAEQVIANFFSDADKIEVSELIWERKSLLSD